MTSSSYVETEDGYMEAEPVEESQTGYVETDDGYVDASDKDSLQESTKSESAAASPRVADDGATIVNGGRRRRHLSVPTIEISEDSLFP